MWKAGTKLRWWVALAVSVALLLSGWLYWDREPQCRGVPASTYVQRLIDPTFQRHPPFDAIRAMGPDVAVPALVRVLETQDSILARWYSLAYSKLPPNLRKPFPAPRDRELILAIAWQALAQFGTEASPSVPDLIRIYKRKPFHQVISTLVAIGPPATNAIPTLLPGLHPTNIDCLFTASALWRIDPGGNQIAAALDRNPTSNVLRKAVRDYGVQQLPLSSSSSDTSTRWGTLELLICFRSEAKQMAPVVALGLRDGNERIRSKAVATLAKFAPPVREYAEEIQPLLLDEHRMVREAATNALRAIEFRQP